MDNSVLQIRLPIVQIWQLFGNCLQQANRQLVADLLCLAAITQRVVYSFLVPIVVLVFPSFNNYSDLLHPIPIKWKYCYVTEAHLQLNLTTHNKKSLTAECATILNAQPF